MRMGSCPRGKLFRDKENGPIAGISLLVSLFVWSGRRSDKRILAVSGFHALEASSSCDQHRACPAISVGRQCVPDASEPSSPCSLVPPRRYDDDSVAIDWSSANLSVEAANWWQRPSMQGWRFHVVFVLRNDLLPLGHFPPYFCHRRLRGRVAKSCWSYCSTAGCFV